MLHRPPRGVYAPPVRHQYVISTQPVRTKYARGQASSKRDENYALVFSQVKVAFCDT